MINTEVIIDDVNLELDEDTVVAVSIKFIEIGDLTTRYTSTTNRIKVPPTDHNVQTLGAVNNEKSTTDVPYTTQNARVIQNGVQLIEGKAVVEFVGSHIEIQILDNQDFFDDIAGKYVDEVDIGAYGTLDNTFINDNRNEFFMSCPVIDYGRLRPPATQIIGNKTFNKNTFSPWVNRNTGSTVDWANNIGGTIGVVLSASPNQTSSFLDNEYNVFNGHSYRFVMTFDVVGNDTGSVTMYLYNGTTQQVIGTTNANTTGSYTFDHTVTANRDYDKIEVAASVNIAAAGNKQYNLRNLDIIPTSGIDIKMPYYLPCLSYSSTINKIIQNAGYTNDLQLTGNDNTYYSNLTIPFSKGVYKYSQRWLDSLNFEADADGTQVITVDSSTATKINFTDVTNSSSWYDDTNTLTVPTFSYDLNVKTIATLSVNVTVVGGDTVTFVLKVNTTNYNIQNITSSGTYQLYFECPFQLLGGSTTTFSIQVNRSAGAGSNSVTVELGKFYSIIDNQPGTRMNFSAIVLPEMTQSDFMKDFMIRFGLIAKQTSNKISMKPIQRILEDIPNSVDWTTKRDMAFIDQMGFQMMDYAQKNTFSDTIDSDLPIVDSSYDMPIDNELLEDQTDIYSSPAVAMEQKNLDGMDVCLVPVFDFESNDPYSIDADNGFRLAYLRSKISTDPVVKYDGVTRTTYLVAVYNDQRAVRQATWRYVIENYYEKLRQNIERAKTITRYYVLTEEDINTFDPFKMIFDNGSYFLINEIKNFIPGKSTAVELFKIE